MGISGNERADSAAKAALQKDVSNCLISYTDTYQYIHDMWHREWDTAVNNKLHATRPCCKTRLFGVFGKVRNFFLIMFLYYQSCAT